MNILISSAGRRVSLTRFFKDALAKSGAGGSVLATDLEPHLSAACQVADAHCQVPPIGDPQFVEALLGVCREREVSLLVPTLDTELLVLAENRDRFEAAGTHVSVPDAGFVKICRDKRLTAAFLQERGVRTPEPVDKPAPTFPLFAKPFDGSLSADTFVVPNAAALADPRLANDKLIFMEYLDPASHDEFTVDMYYDAEHELSCAVPRQRLAVRTGEIIKGVTRKTSLLPLLREKLGRIEGVRGCVTAQFFHHRETGAWTGIEINPRFGGGFPLSCHAGANYPLWLVEERLGVRRPPYWEGWEDGLLMLRYDDEIIVRAAAD